MSNTLISQTVSKAEAVVELEKMTDADCQFISIVARGANRAPFKILKSDGDSDMLDLSQIFLKKKADLVAQAVAAQAAPLPLVTGAIVLKSADTDTLRAALKCNGINTDTVVVQKSDGQDAHIYGTVTGATGETHFNISDDVVLVCKGIDWDAVPATFDDYMSLNMYSTVNTACSTLQDVVWAIMYESKDKASLEVNIGKAVDDFASYIKMAVGKIPESVIKMDVAVTQAKRTSVAKTEEQAAPVVDPVAAPIVAPAAIVDPVAVAPVVDPAPVVVEKSDDLANALAAALQPVMTQLTSLQASAATVQKMESKLQNLETQLQVVSSVAKSSQEALKGRVIAPANGEPVLSVVTKGDCENDVADTAFAGGRKKVL